MVKLTKLFCTAFLLLAGFVSANAQEDEQIDLTADMFYNWDGYGADAVSTSAATVDFNIGNDATINAGGTVCGTGSVNYLIYADLTGSTKLIINGDAGLALRVLMNRQESNSGPLTEKNVTIDSEGNAEVDLTDQEYVHINAIKLGWGSAAGKVASIKMVKPSDPLALPKEALKSALNAAKLQSSFAKTEKSWAALAEAIEAGEAALAAEDATAESLGAATTAVNEAVNGLQLKVGYSNLTADMFKQYASLSEPGDGETTSCAYAIGTASDLPYGDVNVNELKWADLTAYKNLVITTAGETKPRLCLNRLEANGQQAETLEDSKMLDINPNNDYTWSTEKYQTAENGIYDLDLTKIVADYTFARLHCIKKQGWGAGVVVTGMYLYREMSYAIVGDLTGGWDADVEMTATDEEGIYTLTVEGFEAEAKTYEYKLRANKAWGIYELPAEGNQNWVFGTDEYPAGKYNLTFTADVLNHTLALEVEKVEEPEPVLNTYTATFTTNAEWEKVYAYAFTTTGEGEEATTTEFLGTWPGTELTKNDETGLYEVTIEAAEAPAYIIFNNGNSGEGNQTEDLAFENEKAYEYTVVIPATDIEISPAEGDIAAALAAAEEGIENIGNISIKLTEGVTYTVSSTLTAYKNFEIQGNGAVIDASELEGNLVEMYAEKNEEGNVINPEAWTAVEYVSFHNATIKGLKKTLFYSGVKQYDINWLTINNCYIELAADATTIDFTKGSVARNFNVEYSTIYAPTATTKQFYSSQSGQKATEADAEAIQSFIFKSNTLYNLVPGKNFFSHRQSNQTWLTYDVENNIFVNCGKSGQVIKGMNGGQSGKNPTWTIKNNAFNFNGADTSADEATGDDEEAVEGSIAGVVTFTDAANGDFNGEFFLAEGAEAPETAIGAPVWTITYIKPVISTATFTTNAGWDEVYAYAWTTEGETTTEFLGAWPGTKLEATEGVYTVKIVGAAAPANIIFNNGDNGAQTEDLVFEEGKAYEFTISDEWAAAIAAAEALVDEEAVAVGKLIAAINVAKGQTGTDDDKAALKAAEDQFVSDNADQESDQTAKVSVDYKDWTGASGFATWAAPQVTTYDGRTTYVVENYNGSTGEVTGEIFSQTITGLENGDYKVAFFANANSTADRDAAVETGMEDGAEDVAYVFANDAQKFLVAHRATSITENEEYSFEMTLTDADNGTIKLGLGKAKAGTNWHTMQIKQLTWFTTAKAVYAMDQDELLTLLAKAKDMVADESKSGREDLSATIAKGDEAANEKKNWYNIEELETIIAELKVAMDNFKKANWYIDFAAGEYYVIDTSTGYMMAAGHDYGTRGIVNEIGLDLTLTPYEESRTVTIDSRVSNGGDNHFLGQNLYMDSSEWGFALEYQGFGFYILEPKTEQYINLDDDNNLVLSDTPREFIIVTKQGVFEERMEELEEADGENPVDATFLLQNPNFNRNDQRVSAWVVTFTEGDNSNLNGGNGVNNCAESYHAAFNVMQTVEGAPAGKYELTVQGFYRQDGTYEEDAELPAAPVFFANGVNGDVPAKTGSEDSMSDASVSFTNGLYTIEPIKFVVTAEGDDAGKIYVGVTTAATDQWVIFDNFQLKYYGTGDEDKWTVGINEVATAAKQQSNAIYNLAGQRVQNAQKGLYIVNGKKVVKK